MRTFPTFQIVAGILGLTATLHSQTVPSQKGAPSPATPQQDGNPLQAEKAHAHAKELEKLYPTPAFRTLVDDQAPYQEYQQAVNEAYRAGVPRSILNELVAMRALKRADAAGLRQVLPSLKTELGKYRPETSIYPEKAGAEYVIKLIEMVLLQEEREPGALAKRAQHAAEMGIARQIKAQLGAVEALVDHQAIEKNLRAGTVIPDAQWRLAAKPGSRFAQADADELGNPFGPQTVDKKPTVPKASYERLKAVVPDGFWAPYGVPK